METAFHENVIEAGWLVELFEGTKEVGATGGNVIIHTPLFVPAKSAAPLTMQSDKTLLFVDNPVSASNQVIPVEVAPDE